MKRKHEHIVENVEKDSIAEELGIEPGDRLLSINGQEIEDIFDYQYYVEDGELLLLIEKPDGEQWELEIEKDPDESLGIGFGAGLMDEYRSCCNRCIFCFIDQMPPGMRDTLYFKDDDSRLSFLQGNYVTLTNMSEHDIDRIIRYRLEPINISFQTTNQELRCRMLHNRFAGDALKKVDLLYQGGIEMNGQIVLCKGVNDGEELERSIRDLTGYLPLLRSVSVVPVGLTRFRDGLYPLDPFTKEDAQKVLEVIHRWQKKIYDEYGLHFIHAGDEWYLLAEEEVPEEERYDGYLQLENGVGMLRLLFNEFDERLAEMKGDDRIRELSAATGKLAFPYIKRMAERIEEKYPGVKIHVYCIRNDFFGERITVSGLVTGQDIMAQLKGKELGSTLLLPCNMLKADEDVFLDDLTVKDVSDALQVRIDIVKSSGRDLADAFAGQDPEAARRE
ncbi:DUF512 domain-containing protein [Mediterraneibacter glycyrrhizinilyticus]|uniref:DUF512 domain-containing protein n=1 Tax=Mediterraneibacter glycyrrhizinilyticus TaxID=342942 RepID=UPI0019614B7A|nr:DUF512 domain-containing protein [Mediterraneibacter glycyrrhizinilyticus]MBM6751231.1 DUF512 domain-containing protein [Mediterraneibacter glycyrrhizinilyticus]